LFWDKKINWFDNDRKSFYFCGTSGAVARMMKAYTDHVINVRPYLEQLLDAESIQRQREIYDRHLKKKFWSGLIKFTLNRDTTMSMLGVPKAQRRQIETQYPGGLIQYIQDCLQAVFAELPMRDNYFWRVYMNGKYARHCCPEYLKEDNFQRLKEGLVDRISIHTDSVQGFLEKYSGQISRFILLDHMDWLSDHFFPLLESEWQAIIDRAAPNNRLIWRSGGLRADFIDHVRVMRGGKMEHLRPMLKFNTSLASELHPQDRVHTYGSFYIAQLCA
jgi:S-adenosylmethionine-diacylglycerol 3-amino-3-carboxypropyl transferase